jgi:hypothetical protein
MNRKIEDVSRGLVAELGSDQERFEQWRVLQSWLPILPALKAPKDQEPAKA